MTQRDKLRALQDQLHDLNNAVRNVTRKIATLGNQPARTVQITVRTREIKVWKPSHYRCGKLVYGFFYYRTVRIYR